MWVALLRNFHFLYLVWLDFCSNSGGEERTIEFMKRQGGSGSKQPLLHIASEKGIIKHHFPMNYILKPWRMGEWFYQVIKIGIVQYVCDFWTSVTHSSTFRPFHEFQFLQNFPQIWSSINVMLLLMQMIIKTVTAILAVFLEAFDAYCDGEFKWNCG